MRSSMICTPCQILLGWQIKEDEVGGVFCTHERQVKCVQGFAYKTWLKANRKTYAWEDNIKVDLGVMKLKGVDWIHLAWDSDT